jgi:N-acyl-D-amino-acid deacylase
MGLPGGLRELACLAPCRRENRRQWDMILSLALALLMSKPVAVSILIRGGTVYDGSGSPGKVEDVRVQGDTIVSIGKLQPKDNEQVIEAKGLAVAPGFIDAHSHADFGIRGNPDAESQVRQGITTSVVGQDGIWLIPVKPFLLGIEKVHPAINFAAFSGEGGIRGKVMGKDFQRVATADEIEKMKALVEQDMKDGALGLSTGLEYNPGWYSSTEELIALSKVASKYGGMYISHVRDETNGEFKAFDELIKIGHDANMPAQINHIKLAVASMWGKTRHISELFGQVNKYNTDAKLGNRQFLTADVYPYLYWSSTISVLTNSRDWGNKKVWEDGLADVGGAENVRLVRYSVDSAWVGKTLAEISKTTGKDAADLIMEIIDKTKDGKGTESIVCTAMREEDLRNFIAMPEIMFCSDGEIKGSHPRGAGSFPRIFGRYVREQHVITLSEAIRKSTSLPAWRFGFTGRGLIQKGKKADIVVFNPNTIIDHATPENPTALSTGVVDMLVNGVPVLLDDKMTGARGGQALFKRKTP